MTLANLAGLSDFQSLPSGTDAQIIVYDSANSAQAVAVSGDATIANTGAISLADKPTSSGAVEQDKFLQADSSRNISNVNDFEATVARGGNVQIGTSTNRWQFNVNASGHLELQYSSDSGSTYNTRQVFNNA
jgi:hypothetical protein